MLKRIEKTHPEFYPNPASLQSIHTATKKQFVTIKDGYLTRDEFVFLYDKCSEALHSRNPFRSNPCVVNTQRPLTEWVQRISRLIDVHWISLAGHEDIWLIQINYPEDGKVHATQLSPRGDVLLILICRPDRTKSMTLSWDTGGALRDK